MRELEYPFNAEEIIKKMLSSPIQAVTVPSVLAGSAQAAAHAISRISAVKTKISLFKGLSSVYMDCGKASAIVIDESEGQNDASGEKKLFLRQHKALCQDQMIRKPCRNADLPGL